MVTGFSLPENENINKVIIKTMLHREQAVLEELVYYELHFRLSKNEHMQVFHSSSASVKAKRSMEKTAVKNCNIITRSG